MIHYILFCTKGRKTSCKLNVPKLKLPEHMHIQFLETEIAGACAHTISLYDKQKFIETDYIPSYSETQFSRTNQNA